MEQVNKGREQLKATKFITRSLKKEQWTGQNTYKDRN